MPTLRKVTPPPGLIPDAAFPRFVPLAEYDRVEAERDALAVQLAACEARAAAAVWAARRDIQTEEAARLEVENRRLHLEVARLYAGLRRIRALLEERAGRTR